MTDLLIWIPSSLAAAATSLATLRYLWRKGLLPFARGVRRGVHAVDIFVACAPHLEELPDALPVLLKMAEEFRPNHGASFIDRFTHVEQTVGGIAQLAADAADTGREAQTSIEDLAETVRRLHKEAT